VVVKMATGGRSARAVPELTSEQPPPSPKHLATVAQESSMAGHSTGGEREASSDPLLLSVAAAAKTLSISDDTVYELLDRGELPCLRIGRRRLTPRRAVELVIEQLVVGFDAGQLAAQLRG
jgi:excisionase family DNA binding protein